MSDSNDPRLALIHDLYVGDLLRILKDGSATAADRNVIRAFLKDAGINAAAPPGSKMSDLVNSLEGYDGDHTH